MEGTVLIANLKRRLDRCLKSPCVLGPVKGEMTYRSVPGSLSMLSRGSDVHLSAHDGTGTGCRRSAVVGTGLLEADKIHR